MIIAYVVSISFNYLIELISKQVSPNSITHLNWNCFEKPTKNARAAKNQNHPDLAKRNALATTDMNEECPEGKEKSAGGSISGWR